MSLSFIKLEKENAKNSPQIIKDMLDVVEKAIENDTITYTDFVNILSEVFEEVVKIEGTTEEERTKQVETICNRLIDKYGSKEE